LEYREEVAPLRTAGLIGGIAPESTIQYYRGIVETWRARVPGGSYPPVIINSIDMTRMLGLVSTGRLEEVTAFLAEEVQKLHRAGAEFAALASNTPHLVFEALQQQSPIPLISIVATACRAAHAAGLARVGLIGTRFTMQGGFYQQVFAPTGITLVTPAPEEQTFIHDAYMGELVHGVFHDETRARLVTIIEALRERDAIAGLILGGTELPLILPEPRYAGLPMLDTTALHVARIVDEMLRS
jgi:aspartate racemase